jgi:hypothetical protein
VDQCEPALAQELKSTSSLSSPTGITGESLAHSLAHQSSPTSSLAHPLVSLEKQAPISKKPVIAVGELVSNPSTESEQLGELVKTTAPHGLSQLSYTDLLISSTANSLGSGAEVFADGDDPHWPARAPAT